MTKPDRRRAGVYDRRKSAEIGRQEYELLNSNENNAANDPTSLERLASKEQEVHAQRAHMAALEKLNVKLRQANEQLVITSIQSHALAEALAISKAEMAHLAHHDCLTDLPNRAQLHDRIDQAIELATRHHAKLAVLFLDLDRFKTVNDSLGHAIGDQLLQSVAQRLKNAIRGSDTVCRQGGDEFVLLLSDVSQEESLALTIEKIHQVVTAPYCLAGNNLRIGATIGISIFPDNGSDTAMLMRNADAAMYYAKENGRNKYQFFKPEIHACNREREGVETSLSHALEDRQFELFYQAQIHLETGSVTGVEALVRWRHPSRGLLLPAWFVPIGLWILREACEQAQLWLNQGLDFHVMCVNISARELENEDFLKNVSAIVQETGLTFDRLEFELTETVLMKNIDRTSKTLHALRAMGARISIDDFGTGYSSLSYLKRLPLDTMKIDQSFVRDISTSDDDILLNAIIGIGKSLRHQVVAEGVETAQQLAFLRENRCTAAQGFYLHAPMSANDFTRFLSKRAV
ncbi:MAG: EAL domain-containing protein [Pseudomonadota bacterium]